METNSPISFLSACIGFFGLHEGESKLAFGKEIQMLTNKDREEIAAGLMKNGIIIKPDTIHSDKAPA